MSCSLLYPKELCHASLVSLVEASLFQLEDGMTPDLDSILATLMDIASGMEYIHSKNVIHGDLKPENVLVKKDSNKSQGFISKIADFGLCTTIDSTQTHVSNFKGGTPFYTAPEVG
jgi:serine/threonine protein kinase